MPGSGSGAREEAHASTTAPLAHRFVTRAPGASAAGMRDETRALPLSFLTWLHDMARARRDGLGTGAMALRIGRYRRRLRAGTGAPISPPEFHVGPVGRDPALTGRPRLGHVLPRVAGGAVHLRCRKYRRHQGDGPGQAGFQALLELGRSHNAVIKLSAIFRASKQPWPYCDISPYIERLIEAFSFDRCIWGSDWPFLRAKRRVDYGPELNGLSHWIRNRGDLQKVLWDTPARVFGFQDNANT